MTCKKSLISFSAYGLAAVLGLTGCDTSTTSQSDADTSGDKPTSKSTSDKDTGWDSESESVWTSSIVDSFTEVGRDEIGLVPFDQDTVLEYHLLMDPALYKDMEEHGDDEIFRMASLQVRGAGLEEDYEKVGIRYKGDYSLHHCWRNGRRQYNAECARLSMRIKFNEYNEDGRFFGLKKINLHTMPEDETKLRERLAYDAFNAFGVTTVRTAHAMLYINDQAPQLILAIEQVDGRFTAYHYPENGDGNLYKEIWPVASIAKSVLTTQLRTNDAPEDAADVSDFIDFGNAVAAAKESTFRDDMADWVDLTEILKYMAVDRAMKNWDGITAFYWRERPHNFYWYHDVGGADIFRLIPWDLDKTFWEYDPYLDPDAHTADDQPLPDWNVLPKSCDPISVWYGTVMIYPSGCDHFINLLAATSWDTFVDIGETLLETSFQYEAMNEKITVWADQIAPLVDEDTGLGRSSWEAAVDDFRDILQKSIHDFEAHLETGYIVEE